MKKLYLSFLIFFFFTQQILSQNYTWLRGEAINGAIPGTYGTQGTPASTNDPGTRHGAVTWVDGSGNLWLFGGEGTSSNMTLPCWLNDLWKYNVSTNQWTWIRGSNLPNQLGNYGTPGIPSPSNEPGAREFANSWVDANGIFWLFGGEGFTSTSSSTAVRLGDLWKYNPSTNQWTFMKGFTTSNQNGVYGTSGVAASTNLPGCRYGAATFTDASGNLVLFGGRGFPASGISNPLNDMWSYNPSTNNWTWIKGSDLSNQYGTYGTLGTSAPTNMPGGREFAAYWKDAAGDFIICGGRGYATTGGAAYLNDLWRYNSSTNNWVWVNGSSVINTIGVYGTQGVPAASVTPGGRMSAASWMDQAGNLYMFGGEGWSSVNLHKLNDLFKYSPLTNQWTWLKGATIPNQPGVYGTMGVSAPANTPGSRYFNTWWSTPSGKGYLIGGEGLDSIGNTIASLNDLWRYDPPCSPDSVKASLSSTLCSGNSVTLTAFSQPSNIAWYNTPSGGTSISSGSAFVTPPLTALSAPGTYTYYAEANSCTTSPRAAISITVYPLPNVTISGNNACSSNTILLTSSGALGYVWITGAVGNTAVVSCTVGSIIVLGTNSNGCENSASTTVSCLPLPVVTVTSPNKEICSGHVVTFTASGANSYVWSNSFTTAIISVTPAATTVYTVTGTATNGCSSAAVVTQSVNPCLGIAYKMTELEVLLYPNPTTGVINVKLTNTNNTSLLLFNQLGEQVLLLENLLEENSISLKLPTGIYYYVIKNNDRLTRGKIMIN